MDLKIIFTALSLSVSVYCLVRWWRSGTSFSGNEQMLFPILLSCFVLLPGPPVIQALRVAVNSSLFGAYVFWNTMLKKGRRPEVPLFVYSAAAVLLYDAAMFLAGAGMEVFCNGYVYLCTVLWGVFFIYSYLLKERHKGMKTSISINKLLEKVAVVAPFVVLSGGAMSFFASGGRSDVAAHFYIYASLLLHLWYMFYERPLFMDPKVQDAVNAARKRGYVAGRVQMGGQMLEDEGGTAADEGIVEDARIIHALMVLFEREKLFMNVDIKIANVALMIGTNKTYLSRALNTRLSKNFCQFVNYYRVREVCSLFVENPHMDMKELAEQCGFNSSSNFSIVFKYITGFTPGDWSRMIKMKLDGHETVSVDDYLG